MIVMRYGPFRIGESFFASNGEAHRCDLLRCRQFPTPDGLEEVELQATLVIDLAVDKEALLQRIRKDVRYEIRRAETKDQLVCTLHDSAAISPDMLASLSKEYARLVRRKRITPLNLQRLERLRGQGALFIGASRAPTGPVLAWHVYLVAKGRVRLLHSLSAFDDEDDAGFRALVGRANRLLHWRDILEFKERGAKLYDFGGWYRGQEDKTKLRINRFKEDFGGEQRLDYNGIQWFGWRGQLAWLAWRMWRAIWQ